MNSFRVATLAALCLAGPALAGEPPSIIGHWKSTQCEVRPGHQGSKMYVKRDFTYTKSDSKGVITFYADETCDESKKVSRVVFTGPYVIRPKAIETQGPTQGAHPAHFLFATLKMTPYAEGFANYLNGAAPGTCGTNKWELGKEQDATSTHGCSVALSFDNCPWEYDLVKVVGDELYFGARPEGGGCNADPKHLPADMQVPLKRVR